MAPADTLIERTRSSVVVRRLKPRIGAEIDGIDLRKPLTDQQRDDIYAALLKHRVIFFRDQDITTEQQLEFARRFAPIHVNASTPTPSTSEVFTLKASAAQVGLPQNVWHSDNSFAACPPMATILRARVIPALGGDTAFASAVAAYEGLDAETKKKIETLKAVHGAPSLRKGGGYARLLATSRNPEQLTARVLDAQQRMPRHEHPLVRVLETGERALYVNDLNTDHVVGLDRDESDELLRHLVDQYKIPENQYHFRWQVNSIAFWDNRSAVHYAVTDYDEPRHLERVTLKGDQPRGVGAG